MANRFCSANSDVYLGFTSWAAGSFDVNYVLSATPTDNGGVWTDQLTVSDALKVCFAGGC
jgi:endoglucanase